MFVDVVGNVLGVLGRNRTRRRRVTPAERVIHNRPMVDDAWFLVHVASLLGIPALSLPLNVPCPPCNIQHRRRSFSVAVGAIAGILGRDGPADPGALSAMLTEVPHRGERIETLSHGQVVLGIVNGEGGFASLGGQDEFRCAFLGPLDNGAELSSELGMEEGNPADIVAAAFSKWGGRAAERIRGAFAGIVSNGNAAWAFRDHIGGRTFFYRDDGANWWGATEAKQILAGAGIQRRPNLDALTLTYYRGVSPDSALEGVRRLMYGSLITVDRAGSRPSLHWDPESALLETEPCTVGEARERMSEIFDTVIGRSVHGADAIALSGGIDSPVVAAFAAPRHLELAGSPISAYTFVYPDQRTVDEREYTRLVAEALGIDLAEVVPSAGPLDDLEHWVALADGPWDSLPMSLAAQGYQQAADMGANQVLTGTLAEYVYTINPFILGHLASHGRLRALLGQIQVRRDIGRSWPSLAKQLLRELMPAPIGKAYAALRRRESTFAPPWTDAAVMGAAKYPSPLQNPVRQRWAIPTMQATRGTTTTSEAVEACAASVGITIRNPLADRDLWEFFLKLPVEIKFPDTVPKSLIRQAMRGRIPDAILDRRDKTIFDEHVLATVPWERLHHFLDGPDYRLDGINYELLRQRIEGRDMHPVEVVWAYDLCAVHAFLETF